MKIVVLGGNGTMGARVARLLENAGHEVVAASRSTGLDAYVGTGLNEAFTGADTVVDCLNKSTMNAKACIDFYDTTAKNIIEVAEKTKVERLICMSIINAADPKVKKFMGYYKGKAAQETRYQNAAIPTTIVRSTQWFELAEILLVQMRIGRFSLVPRMASQPVAADSVARQIVLAVELGLNAPAEIELAGPEPRDMSQLARLVAKDSDSTDKYPRGLHVIAFPLPGFRALNGGLLPASGIPTDSTTFEQWLAAGKTAHE